MDQMTKLKAKLLNLRSKFRGAAEPKLLDLGQVCQDLELLLLLIVSVALPWRCRSEAFSSTAFPNTSISTKICGGIPVGILITVVVQPSFRMPKASSL